MATQAAKKSKRETRLEEDIAALERRVSELAYLQSGGNLTKVLVTGMRATALVACFYFVTDLVKALSGKDTKADISFNIGAQLLSHLDLDVEIINLETIYLIAFVILSILTLSAVGWAFRERALRKHQLEKSQERIVKLERLIDPTRTSSYLTPQGETNPQDRI